MVNFVWMLADVTHAGPPSFDPPDFHPDAGTNNRTCCSMTLSTSSQKTVPRVPLHETGLPTWDATETLSSYLSSLTRSVPLRYSVALTRSMLDQGRNS
jgi:hypothetical protein